jgi:hypothetical protein
MLFNMNKTNGIIIRHKCYFKEGIKKLGYMYFPQSVFKEDI